MKTEKGGSESTDGGEPEAELAFEDADDEEAESTAPLHPPTETTFVRAAFFGDATEATRRSPGRL